MLLPPVQQRQHQEWLLVALLGQEESPPVFGRLQGAERVQELQLALALGLVQELPLVLAPEEGQGRPQVLMQGLPLVLELNQLLLSAS